MWVLHCLASASLLTSSSSLAPRKRAWMKHRELQEFKVITPRPWPHKEAVGKQQGLISPDLGWINILQKCPGWSGATTPWSSGSERGTLALRGKRQKPNTPSDLETLQFFNLSKWAKNQTWVMWSQSNVAPMGTSDHKHNLWISLDNQILVSLDWLYLIIMFEFPDSTSLLTCP